MYVHKARQKPFVPSNGFKSLSKRPVTPLLNEALEESEELPYNAFCQDIFDQETGEKISFTKAKWTPKEGRLSLNAKIILDMGTGRLDIKSKSLDQSSSFCAIESLQSYNSRFIPNNRVTEFMVKGPLTPHMHVDWDPRSNKIRRGEENSSVSEDLSSHRDFSLAVSYLSNSVGGNDSYSYSVQSKEESHLLVAMIDEDQWSKLQNKIFSELFATLEIMEKNKSLTKEELFPGGIPALKKIAHQLA
ncbi:hypothetical protein EON65_37970 [archaeon]|nr:MAG: hypothetical protein EON65_37970 [archaeon]